MYTYNGSSWDLSETRRFVWYNWLLLEELDVDASGAVTGVAKKYTWGLDLAGLNGGGTAVIEGAGGIGGLLAVHDPEDDPTPDKNYVYFYDANGNVGQLIDWENDGTLVARYEYDPYGGNLLDPTDPQESGPYAADNPFRFSTKCFDAETALGYWGYRYYSPRLGRWLSRDPMGELGGSNVYSFVGNMPMNAADPDGRYIIALGGALGIGDGPWGSTVAKLAELERQWYKVHRPCTEFAPKSLDFISAPTGLLLIAPNWDAAIDKLQNAIREYDAYRERIEERRRNGECVCPEYLHVVGFSDGASTIGGWLNEGAPGQSKWSMGLMGAVDLVRIARGNALKPNKTIGTAHGVKKTVGITHVNVWNHTPWYHLTQGNWTGHFLPGWSNWGNDDGTAHSDFPGHTTVFQVIGLGMFTDALPQLKDSCKCSGDE